MSFDNVTGAGIASLRIPVGKYDNRAVFPGLPEGDSSLSVRVGQAAQMSLDTSGSPTNVLFSGELTLSTAFPEVMVALARPQVAPGERVHGIVVAREQIGAVRTYSLSVSVAGTLTSVPSTLQLGANQTIAEFDVTGLEPGTFQLIVGNALGLVCKSTRYEVSEQAIDEVGVDGLGGAQLFSDDGAVPPTTGGCEYGPHFCKNCVPARAYTGAVSDQCGSCEVAPANALDCPPSYSIYVPAKCEFNGANCHYCTLTSTATLLLNIYVFTGESKQNCFDLGIPSIGFGFHFERSCCRYARTNQQVTTNVLDCQNLCDHN